MVDLMCCFLVSGVFVLSFIFFPQEFVFGTFGSLAGITLCSFVLLLLHGFVINLFCILLSGRSAVGNMSVGGLKPHVLGELEFVSCFNLRAPLAFSIGKLQKLALSLCAWNFVSFFSIFCSNHSGTLFSLGCLSACSWRKSVLSLASSSLH